MQKVLCSLSQAANPASFTVTVKDKGKRNHISRHAEAKLTSEMDSLEEQVYH